MKAVVFDGKLRLRTDHPEPPARPDWAVIAVIHAGICRTDLEVVKGYMAYRGVMGHEFVGRVAECEDRQWVGERVVGEINVACGECDWCDRGMGRHCPNRAVMGILDMDGCMAERCTLPVVRLHAVPKGIPDEAAVFTEPLAAAHEILEQVSIAEATRCVVMGDGKLGILCAWTLSTVSGDVTLVGHHPEKLERAAWHGLKTAPSPEQVTPGADVVVEATGTGQGLMQSIDLVRPRGTLVLKSTLVSQGELNLAKAVVNEVTMVGSRCGPIAKTLKSMQAFRFPVERLVDAHYPLGQAEAAFDKAAERGVLKVILDV